MDHIIVLTAVSTAVTFAVTAAPTAAVLSIMKCCKLLLVDLVLLEAVVAEAASRVVLSRTVLVPPDCKAMASWLVTIRALGAIWWRLVV